MQAGVSNQVERVLGLYERKRTGVLSEIDEKPERPHDVIRESSLIVRLTYPYADTWIKWLAEQIFRLKRDLPYKKVTVADFQSVKPELLQGLQSQQWFLMFYWRLFYKIHMLILLISIQLERKRENREPLYTVLATFSSFWPRCADHRFKFGARSALKFPELTLKYNFQYQVQRSRV